MKPFLAALVAAGLSSALWSSDGVAQDKVPDSQAKPPPAIENAPPDKIGEPLATGSVGTGTLSDQLNKSEGVIKPPSGVDPEMRVPAPNPNPGSTIVIPPPGEPGGNQDIQPK